MSAAVTVLLVAVGVLTGDVRDARGGPAEPATGSPPPAGSPSAPTSPPSAPTSSTAPDGSGISASPAARPAYVCPGYSSLPAQNLRDSVLRDEFTWGSYPPTRIGDGRGDIDWGTDPFRNKPWRMWVHSLRWLGTAIEAGRAGDATALEHAARVARDWVRDNPGDWTADRAVWEPAMHRANVLVCLREVLALRNGGRLPSSDRWIDTSLLQHAAFLRSHYSGYANHGTDESITLLGVGCLLGRSDYRDLAVTRLDEALGWAIDSEGATNEQSTGYSYFNHTLWGRAQQALADCRTADALRTQIRQRRRGLATFVGHATTPLSQLHQLGDTEDLRRLPLPGTVHEYAATGGLRGPVPQERVAVYRAGYVFGRSGWGRGARPFTAEAAYSLRFGPRPRKHGHQDHTALTYLTDGRHVLVDSGYGPATPPTDDHFRSPAAHNQVVIPGMKADTSTALSGQHIDSDRADWFELTDYPADATTRIRSVLFVHEPDLVLVYDRIRTEVPTTAQQLWHLPTDNRVVRQTGSAVTATVNGTGQQTLLLDLPRPGGRTGASSRTGVTGASSFSGQLQRTPAGVRTWSGSRRPVQGWRWPTYFTREAAPTVAFTRGGTAIDFVTAVVPGNAGVRVQAAATTTHDGVEYRITVGRREVRIHLDADGQLRRL